MRRDVIDPRVLQARTDGRLVRIDKVRAGTKVLTAYNGVVVLKAMVLE